VRGENASSTLLDSTHYTYPKHKAVLTLTHRYILQLRYGCGHSSCTTPTCFSCRRRDGGPPARRPTFTTARIQAFMLSGQNNPEMGLCPHLTEEVCQELFQRHQALVDEFRAIKKDPKSLSQNLFDTVSAKIFESKVNSGLEFPPEEEQASSLRSTKPSASADPPISWIANETPLSCEILQSLKSKLKEVCPTVMAI
jgi:hypothetical protein